MNIDDPTESRSESTESNRSVIAGLLSLLGGGLGIYSLTVPFARLNVTSSVDLFGQSVQVSSDTSSLIFTQYITTLSASSAMDGVLIMCLAAGGAVLSVVGGLTSRSLTVVGGVMMIAGSVLTNLTTSSGGFSLFGGFGNVSTSTEPAFGMLLLGVAGLLTVLSVRF